MKKSPCEECICFAACKTRCTEDYMQIEPSVSGLSVQEDCDALKRFFWESDQEDVNKLRILFGLEPYK